MFTDPPRSAFVAGAGKPQVGLDRLAQALRVQQADAFGSGAQVELNLRPVHNRALCGDRSHRRWSRQISRFPGDPSSASIRRFHVATPPARTDRCEIGIDNINFASQFAGADSAMRIDIQSQLPRAAQVGVEELRELKIHCSLRL